MSYIEGAERGQTQLLPPSVEEYVGADSPVRFIEAFVAELNLKELGFKQAEPAATGRPGYDPADLLRLYLYGYLQRIRSSRRLEAEAGRNLEVLWLLRGLKPDFKTIADFRKDNRSAFKGVFKQFNLLCRKLELFGAELLAIDGAKFKAVNSRQRHYTKEQLQGLLTQIETRIEEYLGTLDKEDSVLEGIKGAPTQEELKAKIALLKERKGCYEQLSEGMGEAAEISLTDPESRGQKKVGVGYNVQIAVDDKHHLIVSEEVVQEANDLHQLYPLAKEAKEELHSERLKVVADAGYHQAKQLEACEKAGIESYVSAPGNTQGQGPKGATVYPKSEFRYESATDSYHCPGGSSLAHGYSDENRGYYYNVTACGQCALKRACTTARYRKISRLPNEEVIDRQAARTRRAPEVIRKRKTIVEHVFGTLRLWGHDAFLCKGLEKVRAEFNLSALAYNLRRALNILGTEKLLIALALK